MITPKVESVFIHVTDVARARAWYASLLGIPPGAISHHGLIADVPLDGDTNVILDGHAHARGISIDREGVRLMFSTASLDAAHTFAQDHSTTVTQPEDIGSAVVFYLDDPDGNRICVIWRKPAQAANASLKVARADRGDRPKPSGWVETARHQDAGNATMGGCHGDEREGLTSTRIIQPDAPVSAKPWHGSRHSRSSLDLEIGAAKTG